MIEILISGQIDPQTGAENRTQFDYEFGDYQPARSLRGQAFGGAARMARGPLVQGPGARE
jgi:hypothetical protein